MKKGQKANWRQGEKRAKRANEKRLMKKQLEKRPNKKSGQLKRFPHLPSQSSAEPPTTCFAKTKNLIVLLSDFLKINKKKTISCLIFLKVISYHQKKSVQNLFLLPLHSVTLWRLRLPWKMFNVPGLWF